MFSTGRVNDIKDDDMWQCLVLLLYITSLVTTMYISHEQVEVLRLEINFYLHLFKKGFVGVNIIPKQHYLVRIPRDIFNLGPPVLYWSMRFEVKHSYFKRLSRLASRKNLCQLLADRHQWKFTMDLLKTKISSPSICTGPRRTKLVSDLPATHQQLLTKQQSYDFSHSVTTVSWVQINSIRYRFGNFVLCGVDDDLTVFGKIVSIISFDNIHILC